MFERPVSSDRSDPLSERSVRDKYASFTHARTHAEEKKPLGRNSEGRYRAPFDKGLPCGHFKAEMKERIKTERRDGGRNERRGSAERGGM